MGSERNMDCPQKAGYLEIGLKYQLTKMKYTGI